MVGDLAMARKMGATGEDLARVEVRWARAARELGRRGVVVGRGREGSGGDRGD